MRQDLHQINLEEDRLQREIMNLQKQNIHKHAQVLRQHQIDTKLKNTEQLVRKMLNVETKKDPERRPLHASRPDPKDKPMRPGIESLDEEAIQESIDNLDMLLSNLQKKDAKDQAVHKLSKKFNIDVEEEKKKHEQ